MEDCLFSEWQVEVELRAQVKHFCELTGHLPSHMDGHQHVHVLPGNNNGLWFVWITPVVCTVQFNMYSNSVGLVCLFAEVREVFARVLSDFGIPYTRVPVEPGLHSCHFLPPNLREFYLHVEKDALQSVEVFHRHGIRCVRPKKGMSFYQGSESWKRTVLVIK